MGSRIATPVEVDLVVAHAREKAQKVGLILCESEEPLVWKIRSMDMSRCVVVLEGIVRLLEWVLGDRRIKVANEGFVANSYLDN